MCLCVCMCAHVPMCVCMCACKLVISCQASRFPSLGCPVLTIDSMWATNWSPGTNTEVSARLHCQRPSLIPQPTGSIHISRALRFLQKTLLLLKAQLQHLLPGMDDLSSSLHPRKLSHPLVLALQCFALSALIAPNK